MPQGPSLIVFVGGIGGSPVEDMVASAHRAIARDTLERAQASGAFERFIVVTDDRALAEELPPGVETESHEGPFHLGRRLRDVVKRRGVEKPSYIGGGSAPLLSTQELGAIARQLAEATAV